VNTLKSRSDVLYAEPNYIVHAIATTPDPYYAELWGMQQIGADSAWEVSTGSPNYLVGVVDTGIDYDHPDLQANVWSAPTAFTVIIGGTAIHCPAGSHGFNAITKSCDPKDDESHGTHVSGTVGARGNNGQGVAGVNWNVRLIAAKFLDSSGVGTVADAVNAIDFLLQVKDTFGTAANIRVLSNSWGGASFSQALQDEITQANNRDMLFVAAAGNDSQNRDLVPFYPANYTVANVIAVAATDRSDNLAWFSAYGRSTVHLGAPGVGILSTVPQNGYVSYDGTSMATPHVSGAAALVLSACPNLTTAGLRSALLNNVDAVPALANVTVSGGRLNVNRAIRSCAERQLNNLAFTTGAHTYSAPIAIAASAVTIERDATVSFTASVYIRLSPEFRATAGTAPITFHAWLR
jgi:subtilisin family serine protease